jgi:SNF2 family DNA or RNA helicase
MPRRKTSFFVKGFPRPFLVSEAEDLLSTVANATSDIRNKGQLDPEPTSGRSDRPNRSRLGLVVRTNIQSIDYEEARREILSALPGAPKLPRSLKAETQLRDHQLAGVAWLQYVLSKSPEYCRGVVLADDMGLGKTLQLLTLIASEFEERPSVEPALVVAPVSLLENWKDELDRFFVPGSLPTLIAYGEALNELKVPRASIDQQLTEQGLIKFLRPGWRGGARLVLTTYETLRDLEFSFGAEKWSIMVCDEAQRIKNPSALVMGACISPQ